MIYLACCGNLIHKFLLYLGLIAHLRIFKFLYNVQKLIEERLIQFLDLRLQINIFDLLEFIGVLMKEMLFDLDID